MARGKPLDQAVMSQVQALIAAKDHDTARSIGLSLRGRPETRTLGELATGLVAFRRGFMDVAWEHFRSVSRDEWARLVPVEYVRCGLAVARDDTLREIRELVSDDPRDLPARNWYRILAPLLGIGEHQLAREVFEVFDRHVDEGSRRGSRAERHRDFIRPWVAAEPDSPAAPSPPDGRPTFAILDYGHPSPTRASANLGDYIQSVAALGHLVRHRGVRFHGEGDVVDLLTEIGKRTRPEAQRDDIEGDLDVMTVHRDASTYEAVPEGTWALAFGWYMHPLFGMRHCFPLHRNLRPIFVSFHCNKRALLTTEAREYLRRHGPVGCRDWTTVYLLQSAGVPAFFSGCVTTTVEMLFGDPAARPPLGAPVAYVDVPPEEIPPGAARYRHSQGPVRHRSFTANAHSALELLDTYRRNHRRVVTARLHCYLPARSLGLEVDFRPRNPANVRFDGLVGVSDRELDAMRDGLERKLEGVFAAILSGGGEAEVFGLWRELTKADVAAARERAGRPPRPARAGSGIAEQVRAAVAATATEERTVDGAGAEPVHCAVFAPRGAGLSLSVLAASLLEHSSRPLHLWVLAPGRGGGTRQDIAARFPRVSFSWVPLRDLGERRARLLLPDLLPAVGRLVVLPVPAVATADIAELAELDLEGHALAAPRKPGVRRVSGFGVVNLAANHLKERPDAARELRRTALARHEFDFDAFTADVLVLDLERLRRERVAAEGAALMDEYGLDHLEALHYLVGPERATVPGRWATVPTWTSRRDPGLIYWADRVKPWDPELTPERERWRAYAEAFEGEAPDRVPA